MKRDRFQSGLRSVRYAACVAFMLLVFCLSAGRAYAEEDYQVTPMQMQGTITSDSSLNVRSGPGTEYKSIDKVSSDVILIITGQADNGWYQVEINGRTGYVSDQYVDAKEVAQEPEDDEEGELEQVGEPEEGYRGLRQSPAVIKMVVIGLVIVVVIVMLFVTLKGLRKDSEDDDADDEDDYEEEEDDSEDDDYDGEEDDIDDSYEEEDYESGGYAEEDYGSNGEYEDENVYNEEYGEEIEIPRSDRKRRHGERSGSSGKSGKKAEKKEYILREEDYRVEIDPSFFEDREPIEQPAMVTGYLERKKIEEEAAKARAKEATEGKQKELDEAMEKLSELQREIERLKNQK